MLWRHLQGIRPAKHMTITYQLEPKDLVTFCCYAQQKLRMGRRTRKLNFGFSLCVALVLSLPTFEEPVPFRIAFFCVATAVLYAMLRGSETVLNRLMLWRFFNPETHRAALSEQTTTLTEDALVNRTPYGETRIFWTGIHRVIETEAYVYILTSETSGGIIPKRAFPEPGSARLFYERAFRMHADAQKPAES